MLYVCQQLLKPLKQSSVHLLARRGNVARCLDDPFAAIVMLIQLFPKTLKHGHVWRRRLFGLFVPHCFVSCSFGSHEFWSLTGVFGSADGKQTRLAAQKSVMHDFTCALAYLDVSCGWPCVCVFIVSQALRCTCSLFSLCAASTK